MSDLISRQAAIKAIDDLPNCYNGYSDTYDKACIIGVIEEQPTINPVKRGRWSRERLPSLSGGTYEVWRCSECQSAFNWRMRYCGHCGARMDEVTE